MKHQMIIPNLRYLVIKNTGHLKKRFEFLNDKYNSNLFKTHVCDELEIEPRYLEPVIEGLYKKEGGYRYMFDKISPEIFGYLYEKYLGEITKKKNAISQKSKNKISKKKEQGIFYTPPYIVQDILSMGLKEFINEKSLDSIKNIKILDPACGSGAFLISAFNMLKERYEKELKRNISYSEKVNILKNNLYGVDIDSKAVELTRLNLAMTAFEPNKKLPFLNNIREGDSLIFGKESEIKEYIDCDRLKAFWLIKFDWESKRKNINIKKDAESIFLGSK